MRMLLLLLFALNCHAGEYALSIYGGKTAKAPLLKIFSFQEFDFDQYGIAAVALSKRLTNGELARSEFEGQFVTHFEKFGIFQLNGALIGRWLAFPWDRFVDTSIAFGGGISYATAIPEVEKVTTTDSTSRLLHHMLFELEFGVSDRWATFMRLHHRSGIFGLFNEVWGGSDFLCLGLRYRF